MGSMARLCFCPTGWMEGPGVQGSAEKCPVSAPQISLKGSFMVETLHFIAWLCYSTIQGDNSWGGAESSGYPGSERRASSCEQRTEI